MSEQEHEELGYINTVSFGRGGYQDTMLGLAVTISTPGGDFGSFIACCYAEPRADVVPTCVSETPAVEVGIERVAQVLRDAKCRSIDELADVPVRVFVKGIALQRWEVLREVIR